MESPIPKKHDDKFVPFIYPIMIKYKLERPVEKVEREFLDVVLARRSANNFSPLTILEVSKVLYWSTKIQSFQTDERGFVLTKRTSPSGGARHPIDLLVSNTAPIKERGLFYYNPVDHTLGELSISEKLRLDFFHEVSENLLIQDACLIWFSIQTSKTSSKYENPESLYWKDTGALLYCIQLIATYLGFKSCPMGTLANSSFNRLFDSPLLISGGGILIGK